MSMPFIMVLAMGVLFASGIYLMLERSLTRVLLGFILLGNGVNLLIILTAGRGSAPLTDGKDLSTEGMSDPLPHALILTAIVITFAVTAFLLAMIYRSWRLMRADSLQDDDTDLQVAITKVIDSEAEASTDYDDTEFGDEAESPIIGAGIDLIQSQNTRAQNIVSVGILCAVMVIATLILIGTDANGPQVVAIGGWQPPAGIVLVADRLSSLMLIVSSLVTLCVLV